MIRKLFFILTTLFFMNNYSYAANCSNIVVNPKISIKSSYGKLTYNNQKSTAEITTLAKKFNLVENDFFASGLSTVNFSFDITISSLGNPVGNSEFCVTPTDVTIFLALESPVIYLSNELKKNTCEYNLVLRHEQTHQQINKKTLEYYLPYFADAATKIIKNIRPIYTRDINKIEAATALMTKHYNQKLTPLVDFIKKETLKEQQKLDNSENYNYESTICQQN